MAKKPSARKPTRSTDPVLKLPRETDSPLAQHLLATQAACRRDLLGVRPTQQLYTPFVYTYRLEYV